jgi:hypothetical protein
MEQPSDNLPTAPDRADLHLLYSLSVTEIAGFKQQQWSVTNHVLVIQAALVGVDPLLNGHLENWERWLLALLIAITAAAGGCVLFGLHCSIRARRKRLRRVRTHLGTPFLNAWKVYKHPDHVEVFLALALLISTLTTIWLVIVALAR